MVHRRYRSNHVRAKFLKLLRGVIRIQHFVRHMRTRKRWAVLLTDVTNFSIMVARREAMLKRLQDAGKNVIQMQQQAALEQRRMMLAATKAKQAGHSVKDIGLGSPTSPGAGDASPGAGDVVAGVAAGKKAGEAAANQKSALAMQLSMRGVKSKKEIKAEKERARIEARNVVY